MDPMLTCLICSVRLALREEHLPPQLGACVEIPIEIQNIVSPVPGSEW